jgi:hypothetical protein
MSTIGATLRGNQILPANDRVDKQSNLLGDWKGSWTNSHQPVELKVLSIKGNKAQVEYTHNGHTERGAGTVNGNTITYGNVTIGTRDGKKAALEFSFGTARMSANLDKTAAPADQNKLVGTCIGNSAATAPGGFLNSRGSFTKSRFLSVAIKPRVSTRMGILARFVLTCICLRYVYLA